MSNVRDRSFQNGRSTVEDYYTKHAFPKNARCNGCKSRRPWAVAYVFIPEADALRVKGGALLVYKLTQPEAYRAIRCQMTDGWYVRMTTTYSCRACFPEMQKVIAKTAPSWAIVDIKTPPQDEPIMATVQHAIDPLSAASNEGYVVIDRRAGRGDDVAGNSSWTADAPTAEQAVGAINVQEARN